jgi:predicted nucleic acid-binding protein
VIVTDASLWVSLLVPPDTHHGESIQWLTAFLNGPDRRIIAPNLLLVEISASLARRSAQPLAAVRPAQRLARDPHFTFLDLDTALMWQAIRISAVARLRSADAVYVAVARRFALPLLTWDNEQLQRAHDVGVTARQPDPDDPLARRASTAQ